MRDQYREYLKRLITKSGQSASIKIPKWKSVDEMLFMHPYVRERDTFTNLEFDEKGETDEEELIQAESEHDGTAEQEEQTPASAKYKFKKKSFLGGTLKPPMYQPETPSAVVMKYLVESDKERQAEPPVDQIVAFFKSITATVKTFSPYHQNICKSRIFVIESEVEMAEILQDTRSTHSSEYSSGSPDEPGIQRNRVCDANSAQALASESAQLNSPTSSNMATYYQQFPSQLNV